MIEDFDRPWGKNWLQGRFLVPELLRYGAECKGVVADIGCGKSPWRSCFPYAQQYLRFDRVRVDPEVVVIQDILRLPVEAGVFDIILLSRMMGDVADQRELMAELGRCLKPNGKILIYESITYPQHDLPNDYWRVLPEGLKWVSHQAGLEVLDLVYCGGAATQLAVSLNSFVFEWVFPGKMLAPLRVVSRVVVNLLSRLLDGITKKWKLAPDYFAVVARQIPN